MITLRMSACEVCTFNWFSKKKNHPLKCRFDIRKSNVDHFVNQQAVLPLSHSARMIRVLAKNLSIYQV